MAELKPKALQIKNFFDIKNCTFKEIEEGMLISFNYYGETINDYYPFIYVLEKRLDRIYGLNLRYSPSDLQKIIVMKDKELKVEIQKQLGMLIKQNKDKNIDEVKALLMLKKQVPAEYLMYFGHSINEKTQTKILRNYIPSKMKSIRKFLFKVK